MTIEIRIFMATLYCPEEICSAASLYYRTVICLEESQLDLLTVWPRPLFKSQGGVKDSNYVQTDILYR